MNPEVAANAPSDESSATVQQGGGHRALALTLIAIATIVGIVSVLAVWSQRQLLEQQTWSNTSEKLIENQEVQTALADYIVTEVYNNVDVQQALAERLPTDLKPLAGPVSGALRQPAQDVADKALQQPQVQGLFVEASDTAHQLLVNLIEDKGKFVSTSGGVVTLDLQKVLEAITSQLGIGSRAVANLPAGTASIEIMKSNELGSVQTAVGALQTAAWFLTALTILLFALAIYLGRGRRRETFRDVGISLVVIGVVVLFARGIATSAVVGSLSGAASTDAAVKSAFGIITSLLQQMGQSVVIYGIVVLLAAWVSGPSVRAVNARRSVTPWLRQPRFAYGGLALVLILLFWWGPVVATQRLATSLLLIAFAATGVEVLRRQVIREFPDLIDPEPGSGPIHRAGEWVRGLRRPSHAATPAGTAEPSIEHPSAALPDRITSLERLVALRDAGALSEEEFNAEKERLDTSFD